MKIPIIIVVVVTTLLPSSHNFPIARPNCVDRCGNISIPYPAGTTPDCYRNPTFWVTCNHTWDPPKLFWQDTTTEITDISLDGQAKILPFISRDCYARNGTRVFSDIPEMELTSLITVNSTANKVTTVGCDAEGSVWGSRRNRRRFRTGCAAMCGGVDDLTQGSCMGLGCCQTSIPADVTELYVELKSYSNYTDVWEFNNCGYAFVVDESAFRFSPENISNLMDVATLPIVVNWAVDNGTCTEAQADDAAAYACVSPYSGCYEPPDGYGYRCRCYDGYQGNPYLTNGCQDIDECGDSSLNECTKKEYCTNTAGNYTCSCPKGDSGNGRGQDGCTKKQDMTIPYTLIGISLGISCLLLAAILWYLNSREDRCKG